MHPADEPAPTDPIVEFIGVYDADATLWGELTYWVGARLGTRHCSLCDITHGLFTRRSEWTRRTQQLPVPFVTHHRNDAPAEVRAAAAGRYPLVLARRTSGAIEPMITAAQLEEFGGDPERLAAALFEAI